MSERCAAQFIVRCPFSADFFMKLPNTRVLESEFVILHSGSGIDSSSIHCFCYLAPHFLYCNAEFQ